MPWGPREIQNIWNKVIPTSRSPTNQFISRISTEKSENYETAYNGDEPCVTLYGKHQKLD